MIVYVDGKYVEEVDAVISVNDRGLLHGDAVFETGLLHQGGFFRLEQHLQRFAASAATLRLPHPPLSDIAAVVRRLVRDNRLTAGNLRITLTRGVRAPALVITIKPPDDAWIEKARRGWTLLTARTRRPSVAAIPAQLKSVGRTYALLARFEAADAGVDDVLLLTDADVICEGPSWNIFWRRGRTIFTPAPEAGVLLGVTRSIMMELAAAHDYQLEEGLFPRAALDTADEVFATMTSVGVVPIRSLDGRVLPAATPAAHLLLPLYRALVDAECDADRRSA